VRTGCGEVVLTAGAPVGTGVGSPRTSVWLARQPATPVAVTRLNSLLFRISLVSQNCVPPNPPPTDGLAICIVRSTAGHPKDVQKLTRSETDRVANMGP
jgi:hypothetical protein